jgi:hypothetical protein
VPLIHSDRMLANHGASCPAGNQFTRGKKLNTVPITAKARANAREGERSDERSREATRVNLIY